MIDRTKKSTTLVIVLIILILLFMGMAQLKFISANIAISTSGLCIVSLIIIVIKDMVMSNKKQNSQKNINDDIKSKN